MNKNSTRNHIGWIDALRVFSCFLVVFSHCCDGFVAQFDNNRLSFLTGVFGGSAVRACVPLFVMMTAALLLPIKQEYSIRTFYRKRIGRLVIPLIVWSIVLPLAFYGYFTSIGQDTQNAAIPLDSYTQEALIVRLYTFIVNFNYDTTPLWYLYMLVGIYLIMPILNTWLTQASRKDIRLVLRIWGFTLLIPYIKMLAPAMGYTGNYGNMDILGGCDWNIYTSFHYLSGFIGYVILTYYLMKYPLQWSWKKLAVVGIPMFLTGYAITSLGYVWTQSQSPGDYAYLEILWWFCGINVFMMTLPIFLLFQKWNPQPHRFVNKIASYTFGIYLCHFVLVAIFYDVFDIPSLPYLVRIVYMAICTFAVSAMIVSLLYRNRFTHKAVA